MGGKNLLQVIVIRRSGAIPQPLGGGDRMGELFASSKNLLHSLSKKSHRVLRIRIHENVETAVRRFYEFHKSLLLI